MLLRCVRRRIRKTNGRPPDERKFLPAELTPLTWQMCSGHHLAMGDNPQADWAARMPDKKGLRREQAERDAAAPRPSFGVIITNRDRTLPLEACLRSLAVQD